jgi:4-hydroxy-tetrahydrodipicolinate synthase
LTRKLYELTLAYRIDEARQLQYDIVKLFDAMIFCSGEFPDGFRTAVRLRGFEPGASRQPITDEQQTELTHLADTLQCLLAEHGFTDEPICGCPIPSASVQDPAEISKIVEAVVAALKSRGLT